MEDIPASIFFTYFLYLLIPFITGCIFRLFRLPTIIGYIVGGIILGNVFGSLLEKEVMTSLAYFGIMLLLFTVGLEVNMEKIFVLKKFIFIGGILQVGVSVLAFSVISSLFGFNLIQALLIGMALASSSTTLIAKIIQERGEESSFLGELVLGILMFQDLIFIPFIIIFSLLGQNTSDINGLVKNIFFGILEAGFILSLMYYIGRKAVPAIFDKVARSSRELLNLLVILFIFFIGYVSSLFGLPVLISTFIAGVLVSRTLEHYHIFSQIRPFRDVFAIIFFVFIGTNIVLGEALAMLPQIVIFTSAIILTKIIIVSLIFVYFRMNSRLLFSIAVFLFQASESAFILMSIAYQNSIFTQSQYILVISSVLSTLILTPIAISYKDSLYMWVRMVLRKYIPSVEMYVRQRLDFEQSLDAENIKNHVVICGYGRVGSEVGKALFAANIPFIAIDYNFPLVQKARREGIHIIYGDPTERDVLDYAQVEHAAVILSAVPEKYAQESIILHAKKLNPKIIIISRIHKHDHQERMKDLGADILVQPELEASISIIRRIFAYKKLPKEEIIKRLRFFKLEQGIS